MAKNDIYDVIIVGAGITGTSLLYLLTSYTDIKRVLLIEKYDDIATLNSNSSNNAQTLHVGDIETNYSLEQSRKIKAAANRVLRYSEKIPSATRPSIIKSCQKMVLAVGDEEIDAIEKNYHSGLKTLFPGLKQISKKDLERLEPNTIKGRDPTEKVSALLSDNGHTVDFGRLAHSFAANSKNKKMEIKSLFNTKVISINEREDLYEIITSKSTYFSRFVVFATGTYSLYFARSLGYDKNLSILSIGGNFYTAPGVLRGKVYRVQKGGIPFAAVHGDPDFNNKNVTRFGPTVTLPLTLEKMHNGTLMDYVSSFDFDIPTLVSLKRILFNKDINRIIRKNVLYATPGIGKYCFLKMEAATIVPSLRNSDLKFGKYIGGIRPQIIDENKKALVLGAGKIKERNLIFNITPSPGASSCLEASLEDVATIVKSLDKNFDIRKFEKDLGPVTNKEILSLL